MFGRECRLHPKVRYAVYAKDSGDYYGAPPAGLNMNRTRGYLELSSSERRNTLIDVLALPEVAMLMPCPVDRNVVRSTIVNIGRFSARSPELFRERGLWIQGRGHRTDLDARSIRRPPRANELMAV